MPLTLIRGTFHVVGAAPDGDSIRFRASSEAIWKRVPGRVRVRGRGRVQVRFEAIDALETHFGKTHQPLKLANQATQRMLTLLGIHDVRWGPRNVLGARDGTPGYILTRRCDRQGRPVAFVFPGHPKERNGSRVHLDVRRMKESVNYRLAMEGHAYPIFYDSLYYDLREALTTAVYKAWEAKRGLWPSDRSMEVDATRQADLENRHALFPKLFRRITEYRRIRGGSGLSGFKGWLAAREEPVLVLSRGQTTHFDSVIWQRGNRLGLEVWPEDLVFAEWRPRKR